MTTLAEKIELLPPDIRRHAEMVIDDLVKLTRPVQTVEPARQEWSRRLDEIRQAVAKTSCGGDSVADIRQARSR